MQLLLCYHQNMYVAELCFRGTGSHDANIISHNVYGLLGPLRQNGQICKNKSAITIRGKDVIATVVLPDRDALDTSHANQYVQRATANLHDDGIQGPDVTIIGQGLETKPPCTCATVSSYILFTDFLSFESPLRCSACFNPVPLYKIPHTSYGLDADIGDYYDVITWQSDYQACDQLFIGSHTLERATYRQLSQPTSSLSQQGLEICGKISQATGIPVYYYLHRYARRSNEKQEQERKCPSCHGAWLLKTPWHHFYDFRCDTCRLISTLA